MHLSRLRANAPVDRQTLTNRPRSLQEPIVSAPLSPALARRAPPVGRRTPVMQPVESPLALRLENADGDVVRVPGTNYYLDAVGEPRPNVARIAQVALRRDAAMQVALDARLTKTHANAEMSFRVKDSDTGHYDKIFEVPVHGSVVPISQAHFDMLVASTGPVLRALREMLGVLYSNPNPTAADLGISELPQEEQARVMDSIAECVYFEPKMIHPAMRDYPFLAVSGFDAAVGDLDNPSPVFFEYNLGTPSGLSNNVQLLEALRDTDPQMFEAVRDRLVDDHTFEILKDAIDSNALAWTNNPDGISVTVSPGVYNGAHPDVASIAMFSGMPLVNPSDMYVDESGTVRLDTGTATPHPAVTGIYGRMEESFFLQSDADGIPLRSPDLLDNAALCDKLGVAMEPGVIYAFESDDAGEITGVQLDDRGQPKLQQVFESMGRDPARPDADPGSFAGAIKGRKLYYSGLGGRTVDDKRIFQAVSRYLAPAFAEKDTPIARPPRTLDPSEYAQFYSSDDLSRYVVKEPDNSGGAGVHLLVNDTPEKRRDVIAMVKAHPDRYIVQEFAQPALMVCPEQRQGTAPAYGSLANDWRLFTMMDASGNVSAGPNSLLLRTAKAKSASTNTSQGGGYGVGVVVGEGAKKRGESVLPSKVVQQHVGASRLADLQQFVDALNILTSRSNPANDLAFERDGYATLVAQFQRQVMDLLGREFSPLMTTLRSFDAGQIERVQLYECLLEARARLHETERFQAAPVASMLHRALAGLVMTTARHQLAPVDRDARRAELSVATMEPNRVREQQLAGRSVAKYETGVVVTAPHPTIQRAIEEVAGAGGEIRDIALRDAATDAPLDEIAGPYFRVDASGTPVIGIDLTQDFALAALAHEMEHFRMWREIRADLIAKGVAPSAASLEANTELNTSANRVIGERRSVDAEMDAERRPDSHWNTGALRPSTPTERGYATRIAYPEIEGVRDALHRARWSEDPLDVEAAKTYLSRAIAIALDTRRAGFAGLEAQAAQAARSSRVQSLELRNQAFALRDRAVWDTLFDAPTVERFTSDETLDGLIELFAEVYGEAPLRAFAIGARDLARLEDQPTQAQQ